MRLLNPFSFSSLFSIFLRKNSLSLLGWWDSEKQISFSSRFSRFWEKFLLLFSIYEQFPFIPHICHFFYTGQIFWAKILHPKARKLRQIGFRDKMHKSWFIGTNTNCRSRSVGGHNNVFDILKNTRCQITNRE